jgi:spermidine synthase
MAIPWEVVETVSTADGPLTLMRRGERDFLLTVRGRVLMTSAAHRSEDDLARLACEGLGKESPARVLVSGLGMGFTLRAALDVLGPRAWVVVAELNPVVATWCEGPLGVLTNHALRDRRVRLVVGDVTEVIRNVAAGPAERRFDAIVLDMYEGPQQRGSRNHPIYGVEAVATTRRALAEGGTFAVWCEQRSTDFERALRAAGFTFETKRTGHGGRVHLVYLARAARGAEAQPRAVVAKAPRAPARRPR